MNENRPPEKKNSRDNKGNKISPPPPPQPGGEQRQTERRANPDRRTQNGRRQQGKDRRQSPQSPGLHFPERRLGDRRAQKSRRNNPNRRSKGKQQLTHRGATKSKKELSWELWKHYPRAFVVFCSLIGLFLLTALAVRIYINTDTFANELKWYIHDTLADREQETQIRIGSINARGLLGFEAGPIHLRHPINLKEGAIVRSLRVSVGVLSLRRLQLGWKIEVVGEDGSRALFEFERSITQLFSELSYGVPRKVKLKDFELNYLGKLLFLDDLESVGKTKFHMVNSSNLEFTDLDATKERFRFSLWGKVSGEARVLEDPSAETTRYRGRFEGQVDQVALEVTKSTGSSVARHRLQFAAAPLNVVLENGELHLRNPWVFQSQHLRFDVLGRVGVEFDQETKLNLRLRFQAHSTRGKLMVQGFIRDLGCKNQVAWRGKKSTARVVLSGIYGNHKCQVQ